jgi:hypothetical protein
MQAKIIAPAGFRIAPDGHTVLVFSLGDVVSGSIAERAIKSGAAQRIDEIAAGLEWKTETAEATQPLRPRGRPRKAF